MNFPHLKSNNQFDWDVIFKTSKLDIVIDKPIFDRDEKEILKFAEFYNWAQLEICGNRQPTFRKYAHPTNNKTY